MKRITSVFAAGMAAAAMCIGAVMPAAAQDNTGGNTINVGVIAPLTGRNAVQGEDIVRGIKLAVQRANNGYEVPMKDGSTVKIGSEALGGKINLIIEDTESRPASALAAVRKLVNVNDVPIVLGVLSSGICVPTGNFTNQHGVVQIAAACTSPKLREIGPYFFDVMGLDQLMGQAIAEFAHKDSGATRYGSMVANNPFGVGMEIQTCKKLKALDAECVTTVRYRQGKSDYRAGLRRVVSEDPEAAFFVSYGTDARLILEQAYELGIEPGWYAAYPTLWSNEVSEIPQVAEGIKGLRAGVTDDFFNEEYAQAYEKAFGEAPSTAFGGYAYDSAMLTALAVQKAGKVNSDAIKAALQPVSDSYKGATGSKAFDENGMQIDEDYQKLIYKDGKLRPYEMK